MGALDGSPMRLTLVAALVALCLSGSRAARAAAVDGAAATPAVPATPVPATPVPATPVPATPDGGSRVTAPRAGDPRTPPSSAKGPAHPAPRAHAPAGPRGVAPCGGPPPAAGPVPFAPGEVLHYDLDVLGVRAGTLDLDVARDPAGGYAFRALARSNTFFENIRKVRGRATSYASARTLEPRRYREDATEDGVKKWAEVHFDPKDHQVDIAYAIGSHRRRVRYPLRYGPFDVLSVVYYVRTLPMKVGEHLCVDLYGNRKVWRLRGHVDGEEWIDTPAGKFKTWRLVGEAWRLDMPKYHRPIHLWISQDARRLPVAVVGEIDLGPVRAQLSRIGPASAEASPPDYGGGTW